MFGLGVPELLFILLLALLIFGPKRLPDIGRTLGKGMAEFRRASTELQRSINTELVEPEPPRPARESRKSPSPGKAIAPGAPAGALPREEREEAAAEEESRAEAEAPAVGAEASPGDEGSERGT